MSSRESMLKALRETVAPPLRQRGFVGRLPHLRRLAFEKTDLVTFQFDRHGGGFVIALAEGPPHSFVKKSGLVVPRERLTAYDINPPGRRRLKPGEGAGLDGWFRYDGDDSPQSVADRVLEYLPQIDRWFGGDKMQPNIR